MSKRRWGLALVAILGAWLCQQLLGREEHAAHSGAEVGTIAQHETRARLGMRALANDERSQLTGRVLDGARGVADALICAACVACEAMSAPVAPCTSSARDGAYSFSDLTAGSYFIAASAPGYAPQQARSGAPVYLRAGEVVSEVDIALTRGGARVEGRVVDATGGPIAHARVRAIRLQPPRLSLDLATDAQGQFELWVQPGFIELSAVAEGYARASQRATAPTVVELRLVPGGSIEGIVVSAREHEPVADVDVRAAPPDNPQRAVAQAAISNSGGRFRIEGLEPGAYLLSARAQRLLATPAQSIELGVAEQRSGIVIEVASAAEVSGRVLVAGADLPCQHGLVALGARSPLAPALSEEESARVGAAPELIEAALGPEQVADIQGDGSVHFPGVPPGFYFVNVRCFSHQLVLGPRILHVTDQAIANLEWRVAMGSELNVRVVDERGAPIPEIEVVIEHPSATSHVVSSLETDAEGRCSLDGLVSGSYRVYATGQPPDSAVSVALANTGTTSATLRVAASAMIVVEIIDRTGRPVDGLSVNARQRELAHAEARRTALPLGAGRYRIGPLPSGNYAITADDGVNPSPTPDTTPGAIVTVDAGHTAQTRIVLARDGSISGRVVDAHQAPLSDIWVNAKPERDARSLHSFALSEARPQRVLTDAEGHFTIDNLAPDAHFDVRAFAPYGSAAVKRHVSPGAELALELPEPASITGIALDDSGKPVAQLRATAISRDADTRQTRMFFDPSGRFSLPRVAPGSVELWLFSADGRSATSSLELAAGQLVTGLSLTLQPTAAQ